MTRPSLSAMVASIGTYPYARNFAHSVFPGFYDALLGDLIFVPAALFANVALGSFSILDFIKTCKDIPTVRFLILSTISFIASLGIGFICFVGYNDTLSLGLNILISAMVTFVNAAIGFSAINTASTYLFLQITEVSSNTSTILKKWVIYLTMLGALLTSFVFYLATTNGLLSIAEHYGHFTRQIIIATYLFSIVVWLPSAILFVNASRVTASLFYEKLTHNQRLLSFKSVIILTISILSGSAYAQMSLEFFNPSKQIPAFFREIASHYTFIFYGIMPIAFIISSLVNAYALTNLFKKIKMRDV